MVPIIILHQATISHVSLNLIQEYSLATETEQEVFSVQRQIEENLLSPEQVETVDILIGECGMWTHS